MNEFIHDPAPWSLPPALVIVWIAGAVVAALFAVAVARSRPGQCRHLFKTHPVLFLPPLFLLNVTWLLNADLPATRPLCETLTSFTILNIGFEITAGFLISLLLTPVAIAIHLLLNRAAVTGKSVEGAGLRREWKANLIPVIGAYIVGTFGPVLVIGALLGLAAVTGIWPMIIAMIPIALLMNRYTCTWPAFIVERLGWWRSLGEAIAFGRRDFKRLVGPVVIQLLLLGAVIFYSVTVRTASDGNFRVHEKTNFKVNVFWVSGMEMKCRWHDEIVKATETKKVPAADYLLETLAVLIGAFFLSKYSQMALTSRGGADRAPGATSR